MKGLITRFIREEEGQGMVEYGLILALIAVVVIVALTTMGTEVGRMFEYIGERLEGVDTSG